MTQPTPVLTLASTKGGVGKTTVAANLGGFAADLGLRVLMIDADPQATLSTYYLLQEQAHGGLRELLLDQDVQNTISPTSVPGLDVVQSNERRDYIATNLRSVTDGLFQLRYAVEAIRQAHHYQLIIIDTQGAAGPLQSNGVLAADLILSPVLLEMLSARDFVRSTEHLLKELEGFAAMLAIPLPRIVAVANRVDRSQDGAAIHATLHDVFKDQPAVRFLTTVVPSLVAYREATTLQTPVHIHEKRRRGKSLPARQVMSNLVEELVEQHGLDLRVDLHAGFRSDTALTPKLQEAAHGS